MSEGTVIPFPRAPSREPSNDTAALNDIHALLTAPLKGSEDEVLHDIGLILARTGRPMIPGRHIEVRITETVIGWPAAHVDAEDAAVTVRQDPASGGLLVEITTSNPTERDCLTVTLDGRPMGDPYSPGDSAA